MSGYIHIIHSSRLKELVSIHFIVLPQAIQIYADHCLTGHPSVFTSILVQWITYFKLNIYFPDLYVEYGTKFLITLNSAIVITEEARAHSASFLNRHLRLVALYKGLWMKQDHICDGDLKTIRCWSEIFEHHCEGEVPCIRESRLGVR